VKRIHRPWVWRNLEVCRFILSYVSNVTDAFERVERQGDQDFSRIHRTKLETADETDCFSPLQCSVGYTRMSGYAYDVRF
jgi:hypothetical protein